MDQMERDKPAQPQADVATERVVRMSWWQPVPLAVALGTLAGLVHVITVLYRRNVGHGFTWTSRDLPWMSPLGNVAFLLVPAIVLLLVRLARPSWVSWGLTAGTLGAVGAVSALLNVKGLHPYAVALLALGIGVQLGRAARGRARAWSRWTPALAVVALLYTGVAYSLAGRPATATGIAGGGTPNVLVLILDTVRAASTSLHGYARSTTPALERLAAEGARFDWAISPSSWTLPSHAAMFTGRPGSTLSTSWRTPLDDTHPTVAEVLRAKGYATGAFVGNLFYTHHESGLQRGFQVLRDFRRSRIQVLWSTTLGQTPLVDRLLWGKRTPRALVDALRAFELRARAEPQNDRRRAAEIIDEFLGWQGRLDVPWFAFLNLYDAHDPYEPPPGYRTTFAQQQTKQDAYDAGIRYMDDQLDRLVNVLRARGALDNTLVVVTSDHGEQWGEHNLSNHGNSLYLPVIHVPLVIRWPARVPAARRVIVPVSLTDLAATILDATGAADRRIPGASLLTTCCGGGAPSLVVSETEALDPSARITSPAERGALASVLRDSLQYIRNGDSTYQLFNVVRDYAQDSNLVALPAACGGIPELDSLLRSVSTVPATPPFTRDRCRPAESFRPARRGASR
ncbi:MAG: sulfatase [Gemmatimonadaceae bacterium]